VLLEKELPFPNFEEYTISCPGGEKLIESSNFIGKEFAHGEYASFVSKLLAVNGELPEEILRTGEKNKRASEIFILENESGELVAACVSKYYSWQTISNQICFSLENDQKTIKLDRFGNMLTDGDLNKHMDLVAELAYNVVSPIYRGKGVGDKMFKLRLARVASLAEMNRHLAVFTMSRGAHIESGEGNKILNYLLELECKANGKLEDGRVLITGISHEVEKVLTDLGLDSDFDLKRVHQDSTPIVHLSYKYGLKFKGLFKDLSPIFGETIE